MIRTATVKDIPQIKKIWERAFDDPINYVDFLYDRITAPERTLVWDEEGNVLAIAMSMDCVFSYKDQTLPGIYIFGCATLPGNPWQSIQTKLINRLEREGEKRGARMSLIVPGNTMLYSFCRELGYTSEFPYRKVSLRPGVLGDMGEPDAPVAYNTISSEDMFSIREEALFEIPHVRWEEEQMSFLIMDAITYGEIVASYDGEKGRSYVVYSMKKSHMHVRECLGTSEESVRTILSALIDEHNPRRVHLRLPASGGVLPFEGQKKKYGLAKLFGTGRNLTGFEPYMNLMLD